MKNLNTHHLETEAKMLRKLCLEMIAQSGTGHPGGSLSLIEIIQSLMSENGLMNLTSQNLEDKFRHRLILSKGHGVPALYAMMYLRNFGITSDELLTFRQLDSRLQGHPDRQRLPFVEASTGSLGQGLSIAQGWALANKIEKNDFKTYCILGDGEIQEGQVWEAAMSAAHYKLSNLVAIVDYNKGQIDGFVKDVIGLEPLAEKWKAFGFEVTEIDGHNYQELHTALSKNTENKPKCIIANTVKGKGVSFMENKIDWHGKAPSQEELKQALNELN